MGNPTETWVKKVAKKAAAKQEFPQNMVEKKPRTFSIGGDIRPSGDLTRFVKWPKYVRIQRSRRILYQRIKVPPAINQFKNTFDKRQAGQLFRLLNQLKPESKSQKAERIGEAAEAKAAGKICRLQEASVRQDGDQPCDQAGGGEGGQAGGHRTRCRPDRDRDVAAVALQGPRRALLHC